MAFKEIWYTEPHVKGTVLTYEVKYFDVEQYAAHVMIPNKSTVEELLEFCDGLQKFTLGQLPTVNELPA